MEFIEITKDQYRKLLGERVQFEYFDGDYWYVKATLDNEDENKNNGLPYNLRICLSVIEDKSLTFFNNDRLKDIINYVSIVDINIIDTISRVAFTNYDLDGTPEQEWLNSFIGYSVENINSELKRKGFDVVECRNDYKHVWSKENLNTTVIARTEMTNESIDEVVTKVWHFEGVYKDM